ncbi:Retrovirus-related Pol polyprotein from transposon 297 [Eumeta japonica]|uniref:Retrovirus-related Pol polyprotein from transposon 297 n=1 Tax=Eumeta variegata TaxID=151549 RepID=A0A4C1XF09_EUMVA|nr:Retrovirus-related Pol polyprotein from transposon 297 [Eumeta japonica]
MYSNNRYSHQKDKLSHWVYTSITPSPRVKPTTPCYTSLLRGPATSPVHPVYEQPVPIQISYEAPEDLVNKLIVRVTSVSSRASSPSPSRSQSPIKVTKRKNKRQASLSSSNEVATCSDSTVVETNSESEKSETSFPKKQTSTEKNVQKNESGPQPAGDTPTIAATSAQVVPGGALKVTGINLTVPLKLKPPILSFCAKAPTIKILCPDIKTCRRLIKYLVDNEVQFHTYALKEERKLKTVIRGIPADFGVDGIKTDLCGQGFSVHSMHRIVRRDGSRLWLVPAVLLKILLKVLPKVDEAKLIFKILIKCAVFGSPSRSPGQCHRYQHYGQVKLQKTFEHAHSTSLELGKLPYPYGKKSKPPPGCRFPPRLHTLHQPEGENTAPVLPGSRTGAAQGDHPERAPRAASVPDGSSSGIIRRGHTNYFGHIISKNGIKPNPAKVKAVQTFPVPKNSRDIKAFLGSTGYYRRFIPNFSEITKPLTSLLKKNVAFRWTEIQQESFEKCKRILINPPILQYPNFSKEFILTTDASIHAIGAILSQGEIGKDLPIAYASRTLNKAEFNYSTIERELLAIIWSVKHFRPYLFGRKFKIVTDHKPLTWLFSVKDPGSRLVRWRLKLEEYEY